MLEEATERYLATRDDLTDAHAPLVAALRMAAVSLDKRMNAALFAQYRLLFAQLAKTEEGESQGQSELADFLQAHGRV